MSIAQHFNTQVQAKNTHSVDNAKKQLAAITPIAQQQYENALKVNGVDAIIYARLHSGRVCTCSQGKQITESPVFDDAGNASQLHIQAMLTGTEVKIKRYGSRESNGVDVTAQNIDVPIFHNNPTNDLDDPVDQNVIDGELDLEFPLGAGHAGLCGVCFGTGFVGGYAPLNHNRQVVDSTSPNLVLSGVSRCPDEFPTRFEWLDPKGFIETNLLIPFNSSVVRISLYNNTDEISAANYILKVWDGADWVVSDLTTYNTGIMCKVRIYSVALTKITHMEVQTSLGIHTYIEYPRLSKTGDLSVLDAVDGVSINVGPTVSSVQTFDIIADVTYGKLWLVTSSNWFNDANLNIHGWDIQARLVQSYEAMSNLYVPKPIGSKTVRFNPRT